MNSNGKTIEETIVEKALENGASLAGIARVADLKKSKSFEIYDRKPYYPEYKGIDLSPNTDLSWYGPWPTHRPNRSSTGGASRSPASRRETGF